MSVYKKYSTLVTQMWVVSLSPQLFPYKQPATHRIPIFMSDKCYLKWIFFNSTESQAEEEEGGEFIRREEGDAIEKMFITVQILHPINATCGVTSTPGAATLGSGAARGGEVTEAGLCFQHPLLRCLAAWARSFHAHHKELGNLVSLSALFTVT